MYFESEDQLPAELKDSLDECTFEFAMAIDVGDNTYTGPLPDANDDGEDKNIVAIKDEGRVWVYLKKGYNPPIQRLLELLDQRMDVYPH